MPSCAPVGYRRFCGADDTDNPGRARMDRLTIGPQVGNLPHNGTLGGGDGALRGE
jgi:hypothetical protein